MRHIIYLFSVLLLIPFGVDAQHLVMLSGIVKDSISGEPVKGVNIVVESNNTGTISDSRGEYVLYLNEGEYEITISAKGYHNQSVKASLKSNAEYTIELKPKIESLTNDEGSVSRLFSFLNRKNDRNQVVAEKTK
jgi:uncharacterized membrane protein